MTAAATLHQVLRISRVKRLENLKAHVALMGGTLVASHDDHGRETAIFTLDEFTVEASPEALEELLEEHFGVML